MNLASNIIIDHSPWEELAASLNRKEPSQLFVLCDSNTAKHCLPILDAQLKGFGYQYSILQIAAGEVNKNLESCTKLWQQLSDFKADRKAVLINLGGGVVTDLGGFVAATFKRGIKFFNIPTSLLAMVDASVGGKCGIDLGSFKNQIGLFQEAETVVISPTFLQTLPEVEFLSGQAEMIKHALIQDAKLWEKMSSKDFDFSSIKAIEKAIAIKSSIVAKDERELGERKKLNFGHTLGHALESFFLENQKPIPHGFAIAAGMIMESYLSSNYTGLSETQFTAIQNFLLQKYSKLQFMREDISMIIEFLKQDKKNQKGISQYSLLTAIGECKIDYAISLEASRKALTYYQAL